MKEREAKVRERGREKKEGGNKEGRKELQQKRSKRELGTNSQKYCRKPWVSLCCGLRVWSIFS